MNIPPTFQALLEPWLLFLAEDPMLRILQGAMLLTGALMIFFVFYATRDILLRTNSFLYMFLCIVLVAALPVIGFLVYMLVRPPRTLKDKEIERMLVELTGSDSTSQKSVDKRQSKQSTNSSAAKKKSTAKSEGAKSKKKGK